MSKIQELINDSNSILVFDVDGVLAKMEWGKYNHFTDNEEEWHRLCNEGINTYTENKVSHKMQNFIKQKNTKNIYVITAVETKNEIKFKQDYVQKYYNIPNDNVYCVKENKQKVTELKKIKEKYPNLSNHQIIMVDDTVEILNDVMKNTDFSTAHISSFLDL